MANKRARDELDSWTRSTVVIEDGPGKRQRGGEVGGARGEVGRRLWALQNLA